MLKENVQKAAEIVANLNKTLLRYEQLIEIENHLDKCSIEYEIFNQAGKPLFGYSKLSVEDKTIIPIFVDSLKSIYKEKIEEMNKQLVELGVSE